MLRRVEEPSPNSLQPPHARAAGGWTRVARRLGAMLLCLVVGTGIGLASARWAERHANAIGAVRIGPWVWTADAGSVNGNPYLRARTGRTGAVPMPAAIGIAVVASTDSAGQPLDLACQYRIEGAMPRVRYWTLEAASPAGEPIPNAAERTGFTSAEVTWASGRPLAVEVAPDPQPGNWLPVTGQGPFSLVLRFYEPSFSTTSADTVRSLTLPAVTRQRCG